MRECGILNNDKDKSPIVAQRVISVLTFDVLPSWLGIVGNKLSTDLYTTTNSVLLHQIQS